MTKTEKIIVSGLALILVAVVFFGFQKETALDLGNIFTDPNAYSSTPTYTSSTLTNSVATSLVPRATSSRTYAQICNRTGEAIVWLFKRATTTGVAVSMGHPISASSTQTSSIYDPCYRADKSDPYTGAIYGIASATTTVTIEYVQE